MYSWSVAVQLFVTCLVDALKPEVGEATVAVLEAAGCDVEFPSDQSCCGQPAYNAGFRSDARRMARHTLDVLDGTDGPIVLPSGSCTDMIVHHYPGLVAGDPDYTAKAERVAGRVRELTQFLVDDLETTLRVDDDRTIAYHPSCHGLRNLGIHAQPATLLEGCERASLGSEEKVCCGFGGVFSVKQPEISNLMLQQKLDAVETSGAAVLCGGDVGCLMHIEGGLRRRASEVEVRHIAELLAGER